MATQTELVTAEELFNMPDDGYRYELVRGKLRKMAPAEQYHGEHAGSVFASLHIHVRVNGLGKTYTAETGFNIGSNPDHVRAPDAAFVSRERLEAIGEGPGYWPAAPDLAIEVISPSDRYTEVAEKVQDRLDAGRAFAKSVSFPKNYTFTSPMRYNANIQTNEGEPTADDFYLNIHKYEIIPRKFREPEKSSP